MKPVRSFCTSTSYATRNAGAKIYAHDVLKHVRVLIPVSQQNPNAPLSICGRDFKADHLKRTFSGETPAAWLIDLNADVTEEV